jgi:hypothetical protein
MHRFTSGGNANSHYDWVPLWNHQDGLTRQRRSAKSQLLGGPNREKTASAFVSRKLLNVILCFRDSG